MSSVLAAVTGDSLLTAWGVASVATVAVHVFGVALLTASPRRAGARRLRPTFNFNFLLAGGPRHLVLQALSFALWACSLLVAVPTLLARWQAAGAPPRPRLHAPRLYLLSAAVAVGAYCALLFQLKALLVFEPGAAPPPLLRRAFRAGADSLAWDVGRLPSRTARAYVATGIGALWMGLGGALLLAAELLPDRLSLAIYYGLAAACVTVGAFTTHGLAGHLRHGGGSGGGVRARGGGWRFWQPLRGGTAFVLAQALGWALYSSALVAIVWLAGAAAAGVAYCARCWAVGAGAVVLTSELLLAGSLLTYRGPGGAPAAAAGGAKAGGAAPRPRARERLLNALVIAVLYVPMHIFCAVLAATFLVLPAGHAAALWGGGLFVYYSATAFGQPEHTGRREWPAAQAWLGRQLERFLPAWLGSLAVVLDGGKGGAARFDPGRRYVFGFHHHGLYPVGAGFLPFLPAFRAQLPVRPVPLTASVCVAVPLLRDIVLWLGARVVSRRTFEHTLRERRAVLVCPGGQAEMCLTSRLHRHREFAVYAGHKGFVRMALQQGACLVPILALGEADSLHNLVVWPSLQRWCTRKLGFPIPFVIAGRWCLPLPARTHLKYVIGQPIEPPPLARPGEPSQADVDAAHAAFYAQLERLWHTHAAAFPGYDGVKLVVVQG